MPDAGEPGSWMSLMRSGAFEEAWKLSDRFLKAGVNRDHISLPRHYQSIWNGDSLVGKRVLVRCYHGLGDTIMFIRYASLLKRIASKVIVWAQPKLINLLKTADGIDSLIPLHDGIPEVEYDADIEIMELPHYFRTTLSDIPSSIPYLHPEPLRFTPENNRLNVGLVWKAGDWDASRNIPFNLLKPLFRFDGLNIFILQDNAWEAGWTDGHGIHPGRCTLFEHARIIAGLDLMITVDSMPAHLAGALNVPAWILLPAQADWRWMENRKDSPWYPSVTLYRQAKLGDWKIVLDEVDQGLEKQLAHIKKVSS